MTLSALRACIIAVSLMLLPVAACQRPEPRVLTGKISDRRSGAGLANALVSGPAGETRSSRDGYFYYEGIHDGDTLIIAVTGFKPLREIIRFERNESGKMLRNFELNRVPDTAFTAAGPVDIEAFLENRDVKNKKLSPNEARLFVMEKFPGYKVSRGVLVQVSGNEEWLFDLRKGRASVSVYLDAFTGRIRGIESDDPNLDRRLQEFVGK